MNKKYSDQEKSNWLDYADDKFDAGLINDIKMVILNNNSLNYAA